jgi:hypothetical protein
LASATQLAIQSLPDNPNIQRKGKGAFVMSSRFLAADLNLTPFRYDYQLQYERLAVLIRQVLTAPVVTRRLLLDILDENKHREPGYAYAPEVVESAEQWLRSGVRLADTIEKLQSLSAPDVAPAPFC